MNPSRNASTYLSRAGATAAAASLALALVFALPGPGANAAQTDISSSPLASTTSAQVKPNIMLLMDASGSMGWSHMPDDVEGDHAVGVGYVGYKSAQCNVLYYNPAQTYLSPKKADGSLFVTTPNFFAAPYAGFVSYYVTSDAVDQSSTNLSTNFQAYDSKSLRNSGTFDAPQQAYYYVYSGTQKLSYATAPCTDPDTGFVNGVPKATTGGSWTRVVVSTAADQANFAIWYTYYRTRIGLIKSAASLAFTPLTDTFRVGFLTMQPKDLATDSAINPSKYLAISDFNSTQRDLWFNKLFSQIPGGASPAREGLARVGRMYAGKHDGINAGMADDPVQYSCQQNFTIMTTDGYWNSTTESPGGGPVKIDGTTLVGQTDGTLTQADGMTPRPIWDGTSDGTAQVDNYTNQYSYAACGSFAYRSTSQLVQGTQQATQTTTQTTLSTVQQLQGTSQLLKSTNQNRQSTTQTTQSTAQNLQGTIQNRQSTLQNLQTTSQGVTTTSQVTQTLTTLRQSTTQNRRTTVQNLKSTVQTTQSTLQNRASTSQVLKSTNQNLQSTSQLTLSTAQVNQSTLQLQKSTSQFNTTTLQVQRATTQTASCDARTELCTFVAPGSCTTSTYITCDTTTTGPTLVASCSPAAATPANNYLQTTCSSSGTGPTGTASCTPAAASSSNSYTTTSCNVVTTPATPVASCTPLTASAGNNYTATSCTSASTGPTPVASCVPASPNSGNTYTATTCSTVVSGPAGVASCSAASPSAGNSYTTSTCGTATTNNVPVAACSASGPTSANSYVTTTCPPAWVTTDIPAANCTATAASVGNAYKSVSCRTATTTNVPVASCTPVAAGSGNNYTATTCSPMSTGPAVVPSCTPVPASSANSYTATTCGSVGTTNVAVASCAASGPTSANSYTTTTCSTNNTTNVPVATCTASGSTSGNGYTTTTCPAPVVTTNVPVASCVAAPASSGNAYTTTTCASTVTGPTVVASCAPVAASSSNGYQSTSCGSIVNTTPSGSCVASGPTSGNGYTTTSCPAPVINPNVPVASCTPVAASSGNSWTTTTCPAPVVTTNVPVASCTPASATSGNAYTAVTCPAPVTTSNVPVATCTPALAASGNSYVATSCAVVATGPTGVATCTPVAGSSGNNFVATSCGSNPTTNVAVASCTASGPTSANSFTTTSCPGAVVTTDVPAASCVVATVAVAGNAYTTTACRTAAPPAVPVANCTASTAGLGNSYVATTCPTANTVLVGVASCPPSAASSANNYVATTCTTASSTAGVASCTPVAPDSTNSYTTTTCGANNTTNVPTGTCTPADSSSGNAWTSTSCTTVSTGPTLVAGASCVNAAASAGNSFTATTCAPVQGNKAQYITTHTVTSQLYSGGIRVGAPSVSSTAGAATDVDGTCYQPGAAPGQPGTEPNPPAVPNPQPLPVPPASCASTGWPCTTSVTNAAGSTNSLADVAQYYYVTDLRPAADWSAGIATDNVPSVGTGPEDDRVRWQHMTTFAIGLGVSGTLNYRSDYLSAPDGDFAGIRTGISTTNADGSASAMAWPLWPDPAIDYSRLENWNNRKSIDDFWHAAVNGRGKYFSAGDPTSVVAGLSGALVGIQARLAAGAAAGVSSLQPVAGDNRIFIGRYTTSDWTGDIQAYEIDLGSGVPGTTALWSAQALLDTQVKAACDNRNIYLIRTGATNNLVNFSWNSQACDGSGAPTGAAGTGLNSTEMAFFTSANAQLLSQWTNMSVAQQGAASGSNLVNFLRGQRGLEGFVANDAARLYRARKHVLGDVVNAQPVYVKGPVLGYEDPGYQQFKLDRSTRTPMVYSGANDGMLHAFYAGTGPSDPLGGQEAWALIPSTVLPRLFRLADDNYRNIHQYSVDGTPVVADVYDRGAAAWKTVLVAGLNAGGKGYYAVDVTDPAAPKALWEFKWSATCYDGSAATASADCHLGYTFGKPVVTKLGDGSGTWVVMFTSGYNNVGAPASAGDGQGYLYVLNAITGQIISKTATGAGSAGTPSGLAQINNFVDNGAVDNTTLRVYGGDLLGNVWRFSGFNGSGAPSTTLIGTVRDAAATAQPITVRPELAELNGKPMVMVGTGALLGASDIGNLQKQSIYGIVDPLTVPSTGGPVYADLRATLKPLVMTLSGDGQSRTVACTAGAPNCTSTNGWFVDFANDGSGGAVGERVNLDMKLAGGTLVVGSNVPQSSACSTGGYSWISYLNYATGLAVTSSPGALVSELVSANSLLVGFTVIRLPSGQYRVISRIADQGSSVGVGSGRSVTEGSVVTTPPVDPVRPSGKRISWREIAQ